MPHIKPLYDFFTKSSGTLAAKRRLEAFATKSILAWTHSTIGGTRWPFIAIYLLFLVRETLCCSLSKCIEFRIISKIVHAALVATGLEYH